MPELIFAVYSYPPEDRERVQRMFLDAGLLDRMVDPEIVVGFHKIDLPDEATAQRLTFAAAANGLLEPLIQRAFDPSVKELRAAPLLRMSAGGSAAANGHPRKHTTYDDAPACRNCGAGLVQTSPFQLLKSEIPKKAHAAAIGDEIILHQDVVSAVEAAQLTGVSFRAVLDKSGAELPWLQLVIGKTMPSLLASSRGMIRGRAGAEQPCPLCKRDGWFGTMHDPYIPAYSKAALETMPDVAWTYEMFGTGAWGTPVHGKRRLANRRIIVRPSVYELMKKLKVRGLRFGIVRVE